LPGIPEDVSKSPQALTNIAVEYSHNRHLIVKTMNNLRLIAQISPDLKVNSLAARLSISTALWYSVVELQ